MTVDPQPHEGIRTVFIRVMRFQHALKEDDQQQDHQAEASEEELPITGNGAKHFLNLCHA